MSEILFIYFIALKDEHIIIKLCLTVRTSILLTYVANLAEKLTITSSMSRPRSVVPSSDAT